MKKKKWWEATSIYSMRDALAAKIGKRGPPEKMAAAIAISKWFATLVYCFTYAELAQKPWQRRLLQTTAVKLRDNAALRNEWTTIVALTGNEKSRRRWMRAKIEQARPPRPPKKPPRLALSSKEKLDARIAGKKKAAARREKHARDMLRKSEKRFASAERSLKKWRSKVAYYDKKVT